MKIIHKNLILTMIAAAIPAMAQSLAPVAAGQVQAALDQAREAMKAFDSDAVRAQIEAAAVQLHEADLQAEMDRAREAMKIFDTGEWRGKMDDLNAQLKAAKPFLKDFAFDWNGAFVGANSFLAQAAPQAAPLTPLAPLAPLPPQAPLPGERGQEAAERAREMRDRARESIDRVRENEDRNMEIYRDGTSSIDDHRYERAIDRFDRVIANKWSRADGAYYWKAYALNKLGKRDEALAALAEIPKQFPQSRWVNDAKALQVEIQQASGKPVTPDSVSDEDLKLLAINALMNSEPDRALPLLEKLINDPKNNLGIKGRALYVLAQTRSDKSHEIVAQYAKSGSNQDLQIRAVGYVGSFRTKEGQQVLGEVYTANSDVAVRRAVLRAMSNSRDAAHLLNAAKTEQNVELRREAIRGLGNMQAVNELSQLYPSETTPELKEAMIDAIAAARGVDKMIELARSEKDANVRAYAIRRLGFMRNPQVSGEKPIEALAAIYKTESDKTVKSIIIRSLWQSGACQPLVDISRGEKDPALKSESVRALGQMKGCKEATDYLMELISK
jgi:tetratricopeptide (TPR) repeat protein